MVQSKPQHNSAGFTLIELIIALSLFSFVLAIISVGFVQIMELYQASITTKKTQTIAREVVEDIAREARFAPPDSINIPPSKQSVCLERTSRPHAIRYRVDTDAGGQLNNLIKETFQANNCGSGVETKTVLTDASTRVGEITFEKIHYDEDPADSIPPEVAGLGIKLTITSDVEAGLLDAGQTACQPGVQGAEYCAATTLETAVAFR